MKYLIVLFLLLMCATPANARSPTIETLVAKHIAALGGIDAIHKVRSRAVHGTYIEGDETEPGFYLNQRPYYRVTGDPRDPRADVVEGYDGSAWEYYADPGMILRTVGAAARATRRLSLFDDLLVDHEALGTKLTYGGDRILAGKTVHVVNAVMVDGYEMDVFLDPTTYLIVGDQRHVQNHAFGSKITSYNSYEDYRSEGGVMMWHKTKEIDSQTGKVLSAGTVESVEINVEWPLSMFSPPNIARTPVQTLIQHLYDERDDPVGVLATYRQFRWAYPDVATAAAVDAIGYQILKMNEIESATQLLSVNAKDNPGSARAQSGLGRALERAGRLEEARRAYDAALVIDPANKRASAGLESIRKSILK